MASDILVDTSVWIGSFTKDARVRRFVEAQGDTKSVVSALTLAELEALAVQGRVRGDAPEAVRALARAEALTLEDAVEGGRIHGLMRAKGRSKVSMADALMLATARRLDIPLLTLDANLRGERGVEVL